MPKIVDKEQMRQTIFDASISAFTIDGFHNTTMEKIAKKAGIAKGTLYLYFKSKDELIVSITDQYFEKLKKKLIPLTLFNTTDSFLSHIETSLLVNEDESKFIPVFFEVFGPSFSSPKFRKKYDDFFKEVSDFYVENLESLQNSGSINTKLKPQSLGRVLVSMIDGVVLHKGLFQIEDSSYKQMTTEMINLLDCAWSR